MPYREWGPTFYIIEFLMPGKTEIPTGKYYVFAVLDPNNAIPEAFENNNATYAVINVTN